MKKILLIAGLCVLIAGANAQIKVTVNGDFVNFGSAGPQKIGGRVLVPLRGVMEKIGAFVGWDSGTRTVTAQKGNIDLSMRLGDRTATVNGRTVNLDVPAQIINGVTMVPLRFMGETLGADVKWDGATETIAIVMGEGGGGGGGGDTGGGGGGGGSTEVAITSFNHNASSWIGVGQSVTFTLVGTPKATASVTISGVAGAVALVEEQAGRYVGRWIPASNLNLQGTSVIGSLKIGSNEKLIQSGVALSVDTQAPVVKGFTPEGDSPVTVSRPSISGVFEDSGSGIDPRTVTVKVNGKDVTAKSTINSNLFLFDSDTNLPNGLNNVDLAFLDRAGNAGTFHGSFMVSSPNNSSVKSFVHTARYFAEVGKPLGFKVITDPNSKVTVTAGNAVRDLALKEGPAGEFRGAYMVKEADKFNNTPVYAKVVTPAGTTFTVEATYRIPKVVAAGASFGPATISSHTNGGTAQDPLVLRGKALPKVKVQIRVTYATTVLGALRVTGALSDQTVDTDASGNWTSQPIALSSAVKGQNTEYTVTVTAIQADGTKATPTTIKLK